MVSLSLYAVSIYMLIPIKGECNDIPFMGNCSHLHVRETNKREVLLESQLAHICIDTSHVTTFHF